MSDTYNFKQKDLQGDTYNFKQKDLQGNTYNLSELKGKKIYIKFWSTWCSMCLSGISQLIELNEQYNDNENIIILSMVAPGIRGEMNAQKFAQWFDSQKYKFNVIFDEKGQLMQKFGVQGLPTSVFIDSEGNMFDMKIGHVNNKEISTTFSKMK